MWLRKTLQKYEDIFDKKLNNGTIMVWIISVLITATGVVTSNVNANLTSNVLQSGVKIKKEQYIFIKNIQYKITLEEVK